MHLFNLAFNTLIPVSFSTGQSTSKTPLLKWCKPNFNVLHFSKPYSGNESLVEEPRKSCKELGLVSMEGDALAKSCVSPKTAA